ncbi:Uncharacterized protein TCM_003966 [Theobroma cacao]|uniref:Uncharacterized protein n=1 Tax=Theobroma cacao TaxID=3641 RepID=A0A061DWI7_THECC|nr:Uncharacterized protein TCM_003966 [Theobroma cacao]
MAEDNNNHGNNAGIQILEENKALLEYVVPLLQGLHRSIRRPAIKANNFEIKPAYIQMIQSSVQFGGLPSDDPNSHLINFLEICKNPDEAYNLLEEMTFNNYQWSSKRSNSKKAVGIHEIDALNALTVLTKRFDTIGVNVVQNSFITCDLCRDNHSSDQCPSNSESVQFVGNFNRQQNNPYSNIYYLDWRNDPNLSWNNNPVPLNPRPNNPRGFPSQARPHVLEKKHNMEEMFMQFMTKIDAVITKIETYMTKNDAIIQNQATSICNFEIQMGQLASSINSKSQGFLPSDTQANLKNKE